MRARPLLARLGVATVLLALASCGGAPRVAHKQPKDHLVAQLFVLPNGLHVELMAGPCGDAAGLVVTYAVGADHDPPGRSGMTQIIARLLAVDGTEAWVGRDGTLTSTRVEGEPLEGAIEDAIDRLAERMKRLELTRDRLESARGRALEDLASARGGDPARTATSYAAEAVQPSASGGWRGGVATEIEVVSRSEVEAFWSAHYRPRNARIVLTGPFDPFRIRARIEAAFADVAPGSAPVARDPAGSTVTGTLVMGDAPQAVAIAVPAPASSDPAFPAFLVLAARLMSPTADERAWHASYDPLSDAETLFVSAPIAALEPAEPVAARVQVEVGALIDRPLEPREILSTRERFGLLLGRDALEPARCAEDARGLAVARARQAWLGVDAPALSHALEDVDEAQLHRAAAFFSPTRTAAVIAGGTIR